MEKLWRLRHLLRPYGARVLLALLFLTAQIGLSLMVPQVMRLVIDRGLSSGNRAFLGQAALMLLGIGLLRAVVPFGLRYTIEWVSAHVGYDLRNRLYNHIQYLSFTYHDHAQAGQLISRVIEDVRAIERFTSNITIELLRIVLMLVGATTVMMMMNVRLAFISLLPLLPMIWVTVNFGRRVSGYFLEVDNSVGELSNRLQENVSGAQVVRAFAREEYEKGRFSVANKLVYRARVKVMSEFGKMMPTTTFLVTAGTILILWFGGQMVLSGELTTGQLVAFNSYLLMLATPVGQMAWLVNGAGEAAAGAQRTFDVLDSTPEIRNPAEAVHLPHMRGQVTFEHVNFLYSGEKAAALNDIDVVVQPNQMVALIGPTGSGKTSLINLIPRFYDVASGSVQVDGCDVRSLDLVSLRQQIGIVLQTSLLFSVSIRENIAYGRPEASLEEVIAAAQAAQAHDFISGMPQGYDTVVGERGVTLSGGQRQRVAIARALLLNPRILILDDSTSSVDMQTERLIQQALDRLMEGRTTFVIAHRLSTVQRADLILVLDQGKIVERGTHHALLAQGGLYRQIYELQLRDQERFRDELEALAEDRSVLPAGSRSRSLE